MSKRVQILNNHEINQKIDRLAWEIYEDNLDQNTIVVVGVSGRGELLSRKLSLAIEKISSIKLKLGTIFLNKEYPYKHSITTDLDISDYTDKVVVLVDDVLNSGKTLIYSSKYFLNTSLIKLSTVALIDRTHNRFPIKADYVGLSLATTLKEYITVELDGDRQGVYLS